MGAHKPTQSQMNPGKNFDMEMQEMQTEQYNLPEFLDVTASGALRQELLEKRGQDIQVYAGDVQRAGTLCLQVLLSARETWKNDNKAFEITEPSSELMEAVKQLGLKPTDLSIAGDEL